MTEHAQVATERLLLRPWRETDFAPFHGINGDPVAMEYFPGVLSRDESDALATRVKAHFDEHGFGFWAVELPGEAEFIGMVGIAHVWFDAHFTPAVEIGWRLDRRYWGRGFASEAARGALGYAFGPLGLSEVVAFTVPANRRSRAVMERIGMRRDPADDFEHPALLPGHALRPHVLYRIRAEDWPTEG